jgi:hypothetical protein
VCDLPIKKRERRGWGVKISPCMELDKYEDILVY